MKADGSLNALIRKWLGAGGSTFDEQRRSQRLEDEDVGRGRVARRPYEPR